MKQKSTRLAWQISLAYCAAAGLWILLSDWVVTAFIPEPRQINSLQTMKGLAFVGVTTVLLYGILRRAFRRWLEEAVARQRADESLSASEAKLRAIFDAEPNCIKLLDGDAGLVEINRAGLEIVEAETHSEVVGKCLLPLVSVEQREAVRHMIANATGGQPGRMEFEIRALKGSLRWLEMTVTPIRDPRNGCDLVLAVSHDITARKNTELELRRSEERIRLLIENASDLITVVNGKGIIRFQSPSGERVLGYKPSDMVGRSALELVHPEDQPKVGDAIRRALSDPSTPVAEEFRFRHANGSWRVMQAVGKAVADEASEGFLIVNSRDVTDSKTLEEQLRQAQKMEGIGQLAGGVAHDFNNILAVIQMNAGLLETGGELSAAQHEHVVEIGKAAQRAANLTRQLLLFSRRQTMQPRDLDLNEVVLNIAKMLQRMLGEDIQMQFKLAPQPLYVRADQGMMDQVLMNLAVNSRDAMPRG
ncbi:MAG TPA: PAS domain S-box protein, partial [Verrucomicrobiota bacterium]|nr:PAS domain S-box protein [Verrucomicrobiota bacterium]